MIWEDTIRFLKYIEADGTSSPELGSFLAFTTASCFINRMLSTQFSMQGLHVLNFSKFREMPGKAVVGVREDFGRIDPVLIGTRGLRAM